MKEYFIYDDKMYESEEDVDEAIIEKIGHNYNNMDVTQTSEFQYEVDKIETVTVDEANICPVCGSKNLNYDGLEVEIGYLIYNWECEDCGSQGMEVHTISFLEHVVTHDAVSEN